MHISRLLEPTALYFATRYTHLLWDRPDWRWYLLFKVKAKSLLKRERHTHNPKPPKKTSSKIWEYRYQRKTDRTRSLRNMLLEQDPPLQTLPHASSQEQTKHETRRDNKRIKQHTKQTNTPNRQTFKSYARIQNVLLVKKRKRDERGIENLSVSTMVADDDGGATRKYRTQHACCVATKETREKPHRNTLSRFC